MVRNRVADPRLNYNSFHKYTRNSGVGSMVSSTRSVINLRAPTDSCFKSPFAISSCITDNDIIYSKIYTCGTNITTPYSS